MVRSSEEQAVTRRPAVGRIYTVRHEDYRLGGGSLIVIVDAILREVVFDNEPWWEVRVRWKPVLSFGITTWRIPREIYIRETAFRHQED
jgi:hypothetical protein